MSALHPTARGLLESDALVHLVTLNSDGSPQLTCVWVGMDGDEIVSGHMRHSQKVRNVERDPRVVLSIEAPTLNQMSLREYLVVHGRARVEEGGCGRAPPAARAHLPRPGCRVPAGRARPGSRLPAAHHPGADRRRWAMG